MNNPLSIWDLLLTPIYIIVIYFIANSIQKKNERKNPIYKYFTKGVFAKIAGAIGICLIYALYYGGGDTINYYEASICIAKLSRTNFLGFLNVMFSGNTPENYQYFDSVTGYPGYFRDPYSFFVVRIITPIVIISFHSFIVSAIILASICYYGIWLLFLIFSNEFPNIKKEFAIAILFVPSVLFWGSGLLKDTITISAVGWYTYSFYIFFVKRTINIKIILILIVSSYLLIAIKPYIFFALLPGSIVWLAVLLASKINNKLVRTVIAPFMFVVGLILGIFILSITDQFLGAYKIEKVLEKASISQKDQKRQEYGGHSFDIGEFEPTLSGALSKSHLAIVATLFRPYIWDAGNLVMLVSAIENTYILLLTLFLLFRLNPVRILFYIGKNPLLFFSILFSLFFAFSVGLATSNFGSLVRLKIPCIPFYLSSLFILRDFYETRIKTIRRKT